MARGKATRAEVSRGSHAQWHPSATRPDPIGILEQQGVTREQGLLPIRYGRMLVSPFTFYRGAAAIMASDLSDGPRTALYTQLCGDAHLMNFGTYAAPDRRMVFGINDFDETLPGPFEWDVKRLAASFAVAGRDRGFSRQGRGGDQPGRRARLPRGDGGLRRDAQPRHLVRPPRRREARRARCSRGCRPTAVARMERNVEKARTKDSLKAFAKLTQLVDGEPQIVSDPPLIVRIDELIPTTASVAPARRSSA